MLIGIFLFVLGVVLLLKNLNVIHFTTPLWSIVGPVILIALGLYLVMLVQRGRAYKHWLMRHFRDRNDM